MSKNIAVFLSFTIQIFPKGQFLFRMWSDDVKTKPNSQMLMTHQLGGHSHYKRFWQGTLKGVLLNYSDLNVVCVRTGGWNDTKMFVLQNNHVIMNRALMWESLFRVLGFPVHLVTVSSQLPLSDHLSRSGANTQCLISRCCISISEIISIVLNPLCCTHSFGEKVCLI